MGVISNPKYRSKFEAHVAHSLDLAAIPFSYEPMKLPYIRKATYVPDFFFPEGQFFIEAKGFFSSTDRSKHLLVKQQHPEVDIRFVFQNAHQTLSKKSSTTYANWCDKHGFIWAHKIIPKNWVARTWLS